MELEARMSPAFGPMIEELHDAVSCSLERNWNGARWYWRPRSFGRPWNATGSCTGKLQLSLVLSESTTRDRPHWASHTAEVAFSGSCSRL